MWLREVYTRGEILFIIFGKEIAPHTLTPHLQGATQLSMPRDLLWMKQKVNDRAHFEIMRGTWKQNIDYCTKDKDYEEYGIRPRQGQRNDIHDWVEYIKKNNPNYMTALKVYPTETVRYYKQFDKIREFLLEELHDTTLQKVKAGEIVRKRLYFWGETQAGKTRKAFQLFPDAAFWSCSGGTQGSMWFDVYRGQVDIIFDDVRPTDAKVNFWLTFLNVFTPSVIQKKNGTLFIPWVNIVLTSNLSPEELYSNEHPETIKAFVARFDVIEHFTRTD